jgi:hypothetical protein
LKRQKTMAKKQRAAVKKAVPAVAPQRKKKASKRELIETGSDKRFARRATKGQFQESDDVGRSLAQDRRKKAKKKVRSGQGDRGDTK